MILRLPPAAENNFFVAADAKAGHRYRDAGTGSIRLRGVFTNEVGQLWPGQFVNVVLLLGSAEREAELRKVSIARTLGEETVIREGVRPGETVVMRGQLRLTPGSAVKPAERDQGQEKGNKGV